MIPNLQSLELPEISLFAYGLVETQYGLGVSKLGKLANYGHEYFDGQGRSGDLKYSRFLSPYLDYLVTLRRFQYSRHFKKSQ